MLLLLLTMLLIGPHKLHNLEPITELFLCLMLNNFADGFVGATAGKLRASVYVGDTCYDTTQRTTGTLATGGVGKQVELHVQAVQMLPDIESNYAQNHLRDVSYHDYYQFSL